MDGINRKDFSSLSVLILNTITAFTVFACLIINELWRKGFVRSIFRLKAITSTLAMLLMITKEVIVLYVDPTIPRKMIATAMKTMTIVENLFSQCDQVCSLVFLHEMYLCTCKMEARENSTKRLFKKILAAWIIPLLGNLYQFLPELLFTGKNIMLFQILLIIYTSLFQTLSMIAALYLGFCIIKALIESELFHQKRVAQPVRIKNFLPILLVFIMSLVQCTKFMIMVGRLVLVFQTMTATKQCLDSASTIKGLLECMLEFFLLKSKMHLLKSTAWLCIFEMASLVIPMLVSRACDHGIGPQQG